MTCLVQKNWSWPCRDIQLLLHILVFGLMALLPAFAGAADDSLVGTWSITVDTESAEMPWW